MENSTTCPYCGTEMVKQTVINPETQIATEQNQCFNCGSSGSVQESTEA